MASWQNDKLTKWQVDKMTSWWNNKLTKRQVDEITSWQNGKLTKWQVDRMASWQNDKLTKCPSAKLNGTLLRASKPIRKGLKSQKKFLQFLKKFYFLKRYYSYHFLYRQQPYSNPRPWDYGTSNIPLCCEFDLIRL